METDNILLAVAVATAIGLLLWRAHDVSTLDDAGTTLATPSELPQAYEQQLSTGPSYYVAATPYYFAPPVSNVMPQRSASNTAPYTADDSGCGCG